MAKLGREATKRRGRAPKEKAVAELAKVLQLGNGFLLANNKGLTLGQATALRKKMRENKTVVKVIKNTLIRRALVAAGIDVAPLEHLLKRETIVFVGLEDPVTPAKLLLEYAKDNEKIEVKGGYLQGKALDAKGVEGLSKLPGREQLLQRFLGSINSPIQKFVYALHATVAKPVYLLDAVRRQKEEAA
jgi:large subunit ribosomal protein L10